ncbi:TPA: hypothetical protein ACGO1U_001853 [Streptococcus suis]
MKIVIKKIAISNFLMFASLHTFIFFSILSTSAFYKYFSGYFKIIVLICILVALLTEIIKKYTLKNIVGIIGLFILFILVNSNSNGVNQILFPASFIYIYCFRDIPFEKTASQVLITTSFVLVLVIFSSLVGIIPNYVRFEATRTRYFLGFLYALFAPSYMANITLLNLFIKGRKISYFNIFILFLFNLLIFQQTGSRLTFYSSVVAILIGILYKSHSNLFKKNIIYWPLTLSFVLLFMLSYILAKNFDSSSDWQSQLNLFLGHRIRLGHESLLNYSFRFFGQPISWQGNGLNATGLLTTTASTYNYVDNLYLIMLQRYGILFVIVFLSSATVLLNKIYKSGEIFLLILFSILAVHAILDDTILYLHYNTFWLIFAIFLTRDYKLRSER